MKISKVLATAGLNGFYNDDKAAIRNGAKMDGFIYRGKPVTPGFRMIRQPGESASIVFMLDNGTCVFGDAMVVQYSGSGGREGLMTGAQMCDLARASIAPAFEGREITTFRDMCARLEGIRHDGRKVHPSVAYGTSQAILEAVAWVRNLTPAEVVAEEYSLSLPDEPVRINAQSGDDRYNNVDKMILKKAGFMPQALLNNAAEKVGKDGEIFLAYAKWVRDRILDIGEKDYKPTLRFDCYGTLGEVFVDDAERIVDYLGKIRAVTEPFDLVIEMPVDMGSSEEQFRMMRAIRQGLQEKQIRLDLMIDEYANTLEEIKEWAASDACDMVQVKMPDLGGLHNTIEAVLYCKEVGKKVYLGGSCCETDQSGRIAANVALATQPFACSSKPGMGVDEALMVISNEMQRVLAIARARGSLRAA
jgi:methylaspartate ammonia-lyase